MESKQKWAEEAQRKELVNGMVIGPGKPKRFSKSPWECSNGMEWMPKGMKWAKKA